jgi:D-amino peptidase
MRRQALHPRARLLTGRPWLYPYPAGCDGSFAASMILCQHAKSNTDGGHLCQTMSFGWEEYVLNGTPIGEIGLWMLTAGYFNVPVILTTGDAAACEEARGLVPNIEVAPVKWGLKRGTGRGVTGLEYHEFNCVATHLHPDEARDLIRERACRAVKRIAEFLPLRLDPPYTLVMEARRQEGEKRGKKYVLEGKDFLDLMAYVIHVGPKLGERGGRFIVEKTKAVKAPARCSS